MRQMRHDPYINLSTRSFSFSSFYFWPALLHGTNRGDAGTETIDEMRAILW